MLALAACQASQPDADREPVAGHDERALGLYTSLPITWGENGDISDLLDANRPVHWALPLLQSAGKFVPLDTLVDRGGALPLPADGLLLLAQPRPLTPQENVALDTWVRGGGRVLLFADPMLTAETIFAPGDPRRPQDIAMLSPILAHWGLVLEFDEAQKDGEQEISVPDKGAALTLPVNLPGRFRLLGKTGEVVSGNTGKSGEAYAECRLEARGLLAECRLGKGRAVAIADAALLENPQNFSAIDQRRVILQKLLGRIQAGT